MNAEGDSFAGPGRLDVQARLVDKLADLLIAANDVVKAARASCGSPPSETARIEAAAVRIYDEVTLLIEELAD